MKEALARHDVIVREDAEECGGRVIKTTGDGVHAVFDTAQDAAAAAIGAKRALADPLHQTQAQNVVR